MASPLNDFTRILRTIFGFARYAGIVFLALTLLLIGREVDDLYRTVAAVNPYAGYLFLVLVAVVVFWALGVPAYRFLRLPRVIQPPKLPEKKEAVRRSHLRARIAYLERYLAALERNPILAAESRALAAAGTALAQIKEPVLAEKDTAKARAAVAKFEKESILPLLAPLDKEADRIIRAEAISVGIATAISPNGTLDAAIVLWRNANLVSRIANLYYGRPGVRGSFLVLRDVSGAALLASYLEGLSEMAGNMLHGLVGALPGAMAALLLDGTVNAVATLRVGYLARARCRSFSAWTEPARRRALAEARAAAAAKAGIVVAAIAKAAARNVGSIPGRLGEAVKGRVASMLKWFREREEPGGAPAGD